MKEAMVEILESGVLEELGVPHLTVHDELDGSLPPTSAAKEALEELMRIMETCVALEVPLLADLTVAESWGKTKS
jgi:DNA polymerase I-like protein with 3'-5' exonuclease and polymerase domains